MEQKQLVARIVGIGLVALLLLPTTMVVHAAPLSGAIFTTTEDGTVVNENVHYEAKEDVYLDGGPGPNAPSTAAGLPEGDYYFQVTDPSGKDLLSTDHISCRQIHVNDHGVIDYYNDSGINYIWSNKEKKWLVDECIHNTGIDLDHSELGAITVQLFPYDDTPNPGGVYKAWITPVDKYDPINVFNPLGDDKHQDVNNEGYAAGNFHGFIPRWSKTDNFKVKKKGKPFVPPMITVKKFHDKNINGFQDVDEETIIGWAVNVTDPLDVTNTVFTTSMVDASEPGTYLFVESQPTGSLHTVSILDGVVLSLYPAADPNVAVAVAGESEEIHEVVYGNVGLGQIIARKVYDRDGDGIADPEEPGVPGWQMELIGITVTEMPVGPLVQVTNSSGYAVFTDLHPGNYTVTEIIPPMSSWVATGPTSANFTIESTLVGATVIGNTETAIFTNLCYGEADFDTKGYWHNKNGLTELKQDDIDYANSLLPYSTPSSYFGDGDEPFNGTFMDKVTPVDAAIGDGIWQGVLVAPAGTPKAEVSQFLVDPNAGGDPQEQLAQQLLAFIFNVRHRLDDHNTVIELHDGTWASAQSIIDAAIVAWSTPGTVDDYYWEPILDALNNNDAVSFIHYFPCPVVY